MSNFELQSFEHGLVISVVSANTQISVIPKDDFSLI